MENSKRDHAQKLLIEMVMRQTNLSFDEASEQLKKHNNNYMIVIKESLGIIKNNEKKEIKSVNQEIYTEIRGLMDNASDRYRKQKELEKQKEVIIEKLREEYLSRQKNKKIDESISNDISGVKIDNKLSGLPLDKEKSGEHIEEFEEKSKAELELIENKNSLESLD